MRQVSFEIMFEKFAGLLLFDRISGVDRARKGVSPNL